jgi:hypothetical protein
MRSVYGLLGNKLFKPKEAVMMLTDVLNSKWKQQESGVLVLLGMTSWTY